MTNAYPDNRIRCTVCGAYDERWVQKKDGRKMHVKCLACGRCRECGGDFHD